MKCAYCDEESGNYTIDDEPVCDQCYYDLLGDEIERNPIGINNFGNNGARII